MSPHVLVVDDEDQIRSILATYLSADGYDVLEAATGAEGLALATRQDVALVLLDIGLPDIDGLEVLRQLRQTSDVYVVLVTARAEEIDRIVGLEVGADDYVTKPFSPREVVARVRAVLRRQRPTALGSAAPAAVLRFPGLRIDLDRREVHVDERPVTLTALDFDLLVALASSPGRVFSRSQLLEQVWGYDFFGDERVVDVHVRGMRKSLGDDANDPSMIGTVRGVGYKFLLDPTPGGTP
ncbi:MAG: response regulator transcription factor [Nocardioidaceae bacterium]|nr:response regulator transcription factor [Nocardioidaceae bacterium]